MTKKGIEINEFKEKHNIRIRGQQDIQQRQGEDKDSKEAKRSAVVVNSLLNNYS